MYSLKSSKISNFSSTNCSQSGSILIMAVIALAVLTTVYMFTYQRVANQLALVYADRRVMEKQAIADDISSRIDCAKTMGVYSPSNVCPIGTAVQLWFQNYPNAEPIVPGPNGVFLANAAGGKGALQWFGTLTCGTSSLVLKVKLWDTTPGTTQPIVRSTFNNQLYDGNTSISRAAGDSPGKTPICPEMFPNGEPGTRIFSMGMDTLSDSTTSTQSFYPGKPPLLFAAQGRCDGSAGKLVDYYYDPNLCGTKPYRSPFCDNVLQSAIQYKCSRNAPLDPTVPPPNHINRNCHFSAIEGVFAGNIQCSIFCTQKKYSVGHMTKCLAAGNPYDGPIMADDTNGQVNCLCLK